MKIKKKMMTMCLAAAMTGTMTVPAWAGPEFARSAQEWEKLRDNTLEYGELEGLIQEYNTTVLNNQIQYNKTKANSAEYLSEKYWNMAEAAYDAAAEADGSAGAVAADQRARQAEQMAETYGTSLYSISLGYEKTEKSLVAQAQTAMNTYYQLQQQLTALKKNRELAEANHQSAQARQGLNMATYAEVLAASQGVQALDAQIVGLESQIKSAKQKLCVMTGWTADANPEMTEIPAVDVSRVAAIDLEADTAKALEQDYTLRINQEGLKNALSMEKTELMTQTVANDKQQIAVAVNTAYQNVLQAKAAYDQAALDLEVASKNINTANVKYQMGSIGKLEYLQQEAAFVTAQTGMRTKDLALLQALETYDWTVKGVR